MSEATTLGMQVLHEVKTALGDDYALLTDEQRLSIRDTATMLMEKQVELKAALALPTPDPEKVADLQSQIQAIESTVKDWKVWGAFAIEEAFWKGVQKVAAAIGSFLSAFATEAISRLVPGL